MQPKRSSYLHSSEILSDSPAANSNHLKSRTHHRSYSSSSYYEPNYKELKTQPFRTYGTSVNTDFQGSTTCKLNTSYENENQLKSDFYPSKKKRGVFFKNKNAASDSRLSQSKPDSLLLSRKNVLKDEIQSTSDRLKDRQKRDQEYGKLFHMKRIKVGSNEDLSSNISSQPLKDSDAKKNFIYHDRQQSQKPKDIEHTHNEKKISGSGSCMKFGLESDSVDCNVHDKDVSFR